MSAPPFVAPRLKVQWGGSACGTLRDSVGHLQQLSIASSPDRKTVMCPHTAGIPCARTQPCSALAHLSVYLPTCLSAGEASRPPPAGDCCPPPRRWRRNAAITTVAPAAALRAILRPLQPAAVLAALLQRHGRAAVGQFVRLARGHRHAFTPHDAAGP